MPTCNGTERPAGEGSLALRFDKAIGYRIPGYRHGWTAAYIPDLHQIWIHPLASSEDAQAVLREEVIHADTCRLRPAQLRPMLRYLANGDAAGQIDAFSDIVEAIYVALWPLATGRRLSKSSFPLAGEAEVKAAQRLLKLARCLSRHVDWPKSFANTSEATLWSLGTFLLYVVPSQPGQCANVLDMLEAIGPPDSSKARRTVLDYLFEEVMTRLRSSPQGTYEFTLECPNEIHQSLATMLSLASVSLRLPPSRILPVFPALLAALTLDRSTFIPILWMRARGDRIETTADILDQTGILLSSPDASGKDQPSLTSGDKKPSGHSCAAERFEREYVQSLSNFIWQRRPHRPALVMAYALQLLPKMVRSHLSGFWDRPGRCRFCRSTIKQPEIQAACRILTEADSRSIGRTAKAMDSYETWLLSDGLKEVQRRTGWARVVPFEVSSGAPPIIWRALSAGGAPVLASSPAISDTIKVGEYAVSRQKGRRPKRSFFKNRKA